tara:strand:- start:1820 stop:3487 length:1668 start_codon:yes stop_codon:yes gene_type:complete
MTDQVNLGLVWASGGGTQDPGDTKFADGWISEIPTFQEFNFMLNALDSNTLHFAESAMFNWQADINYKPGARVFDVATAKNYTCRAAHMDEAPTGDVSFSFWVEGWLVGSDFASLVQSDGFKIELTARTGTTYDGQDVTLVNNIPMLKLKTNDSSVNWGIVNVAGEICVANLGNSGSPDGRNLAKGAGNSHRVFHEGHFPHVSEVVDAVEEAPNDGVLYSRINEGWVRVTSTAVQIAPPPPVSGSGQGWYNLDDGQFYLDINDGDSSQWVPANPPVIPEALFTQADKDKLDGLAGRNLLINGNFDINQRAVSGTVTLGAGVYGHDRFKGGASGCTYTFSTVENVTTLTITAGSLIQVVEGLSLFSGTHVLSFDGTAQGKIGGGSFANSGVTGAITGGTNTNIEFNAGTLSKVQLENALIKTEFEVLHIGQALSLCQRYYEQSPASGLRAGTSIESAGEFVTTSGQSLAGSTAGGIAFGVDKFAVTKRATPAVILYTRGGLANAVKVRGTVDRGGATVGDASITRPFGYLIFNNSSAIAIYVGDQVQFHWAADSEL